MKGSVHEEDFFIVRDVLVLMKLKETIKWMKENNYLHCFLLHINVLQDITLYAERPVGYSPEFIPLYNSLNRDILHSLRFLASWAVFARRGGNRRGGEEYVLQFLYTKGNSPRTEAYMMDTTSRVGSNKVGSNTC